MRRKAEAMAAIRFRRGQIDLGLVKWHSRDGAKYMSCEFCWRHAKTSKRRFSRGLYQTEDSYRLIDACDVCLRELRNPLGDLADLIAEVKS